MVKKASGTGSRRQTAKPTTKANRSNGELRAESKRNRDEDSGSESDAAPSIPQRKKRNIHALIGNLTGMMMMVTTLLEW